MEKELNIKDGDVQQQEIFKNLGAGHRENVSQLSDDLEHVARMRLYVEEVGESDYGS